MNVGGEALLYMRKEGGGGRAEYPNDDNARATGAHTCAGLAEDTGSPIDSR